MENRLTFIRKISNRIKTPEGKLIQARGLYKCSCGTEREAAICNVKSGAVRSCGCIAKEKPAHYTHGLHDHNLYTIWQGIKRRCYSKSEPSYPQYGGRGVRMCEDWLRHPENFIKWALDNGWKKGLQIDKDIIGNGLLYSPETCKIVTSKENNNNRSNNRLIEYDGKKQTLAQWAEETGISAPTIHVRIFTRKWPIEKALTHNPKLYHNRCVSQF
jgi:hypothetical protein